MTGPKALGVAGIVPESSLIRRWRQWFAPDVQPFVVDDRLRDSLGAGHLTDLPMELQDTFMIYDPQSHRSRRLESRRVRQSRTADACRSYSIPGLGRATLGADVEERSRDVATEAEG